MTLKTIDDLVNEDESVRTYIRKMVLDASWPQVKDLFLSNVPAGEGGKRKDAILCHGKYLGIRFMCNELERIAKKKIEKGGPKPTPTTQDPDLADR
jgi:hypothetical protein